MTSRPHSGQAFLYGQWEEALRSPLYTLAEIADGLEERMLAHLDGLVIGGPKVANKLVLPALASDEPELVFAVTFALVDGDRPEDFEAVIDALGKGEPAQRAAIRRALSVVPRPNVGPRLAALALKVAPCRYDRLALSPDPAKPFPVRLQRRPIPTQ